MASKKKSVKAPAIRDAELLTSKHEYDPATRAAFSDLVNNLADYHGAPVDMLASFYFLRVGTGTADLCFMPGLNLAEDADKMRYFVEHVEILLEKIKKGLAQ